MHFEITGRVLLLLVSWCSLCFCRSIDNDSDFVWGTSSSSYQYEGHISADGKQPSIWDEYCLQGHCKGENANTADNQYNLDQLNDDVTLMKDLGTSAYRLSFAWPRIMTSSGNATSNVNTRMTYPTKVEQHVNTAGIVHYARVLDVLRKRDITPLVTLWHWDTPLWIEELGGWLNDDMPAYFAEYAEAVFRAYGQSDIQNWLTLNEPHTVATAGYMYGVGAPGRCSDRSVCAQGNSSTEPYIAAHNMLRAHAHTVSIFRQLQTEGVVRKDARISMAISAD